MTEGEGAFLPSLFFAASRASRIASQRASICRFAGTTRPSLRVIVAESAGSREIPRLISADWSDGGGFRVGRDFCCGLHLVREIIACAFRQNGAELLTDLDRRIDLRFPFAHRARERRFDRINRFVGFEFAECVIELDAVARFFQAAPQLWPNEFLRP